MSSATQQLTGGIAPQTAERSLGRSATVAWQMVGADVLKTRKKRGTVIWSAVLTALPLVIYFTVRAVQHNSNPMTYGPAGGLQGYSDGLRLLALFMGPLAAILIGAEAGAGDSSAGVFRDLVATGRSRLSLFASRVPAALAVCWAFVLGSFALLLAGTFIFAGSGPTPSGSLIVNGVFFSLLATGVVCAIAAGFASLTNSRPATITALIGWQLVVSRLIGSISSLGSARDLLLTNSLAHYSPVFIGDRAATVAVSGATALIVMLGWLAVFLGLGAWRTATMDT